MSKLGELQNIATGLLGKFVSRNNDIGGYWAIGLLRREICVQPAKVELDLVGEQSTPYSELAMAALRPHAEWLRTMLKKRGIPWSEMTDATVTLEFGTFGCLPARAYDTYGEPFYCTVAITDRFGHVRSVAHAGRCAPHNPGVESQSTRAC